MIIILLKIAGFMVFLFAYGWAVVRGTNWLTPDEEKIERELIRSNLFVVVREDGNSYLEEYEIDECEQSLSGDA